MPTEEIYPPNQITRPERERFVGCERGIGSRGLRRKKSPAAAEVPRRDHDSDHKLWSAYPRLRKKGGADTKV